MLGVNMTNERPLDVLEKAKGKKVLVKLKNGEQLSGLLRAVDLHLNLWLDEADLIEGDNRKKIGTILIRGDNVLFIAPE